jgi:hypothetical protein
MKKFLPKTLILALLGMVLLVGCNNSSSDTQPAALSDTNINLIFVVSPDLAYHTTGDIQPDTANLTNQGLNRSLQMASYLKEKVLGSKNVKSIYALSPMTHLQTQNNYPDMAAIGYIQQFAMLNQETTFYTANTYPIKVSYTDASVPNGVSVPSEFCPNCTGLDFNNYNANNDTLATSIINENNASGFYVFSAPWEVVSAMMTNINAQHGYKLNLPNKYSGSNYIYAISIPVAGDAKLTVYNTQISPSVTTPVLPAPVATTECKYLQPNIQYVRTQGVDGVSVPANANKNQTIYFVRHAEAHPDSLFKFENGNYVAAGQWRALALSNVLKGKIETLDMVYSIVPAQWFPYYGTLNFSFFRPSLTILPFVIDNNLPYSLVANFQLGTNPLDENASKKTSEFFFTGGNFSNKKILTAWESGHIRPFLNHLLTTYGGNPTLLNVDANVSSGLPKGGWPSDDYNTIWRVIFDANGNLSVDNNLCEGIDSATLPVSAPLF